MDRQRGRMPFVAGLLIVAASDLALVAMALTESGSDALIVLLAGSAVLAGFFVGRWWAVLLALPLFLALIPLYDQEGQELNFVGWVVLVAGLVAGIQAAALALGVGSRWALAQRDQVSETLRR